MRRLGSGSAAAPQWAPPEWTPPVDVDGVPYYLDKDPVAPPPPAPPMVGPDGVPYYLALPEGWSAPLPPWVVPVAIGAGVFVLLGGVGLLVGRRRKRRR